MDTRVASYAVIVDEGRMLLVHWSGGDSRHSGWSLPGGGVERGEHPDDAVVREVREETGYDVEVDGTIGVSSTVIRAADRIDPGKPDLHGIGILYRAHVVGGTLATEADGSTDEAAWVPLDAVDDLHRVPLVDTARRLAGLPVRD